MKLYTRKPSGKLSLGIEVRESGLAIALCGGLRTQEDKNLFELHKLKILDKGAQNNLEIALKDWVDKEKLRGAACSLTLRSGTYQLLLTEAPEVPDAEIRSAIRWKIKDLTSIPLENAAIEAFLLPADGSRSGKKMAYVVVTELTKIKALIQMVKNARLELQAIDIAELSLRNLSLLKPEAKENPRGVALVRLIQGSATVYLFRNSNLYLSRQFQLAYGGGLLDDIPEDNFLLEVQRSLDYYERQMGLVPPVALYVCGENISADKLAQNIVRGLSIPVQFLDLENLFFCSENLETDLLQECANAVGAALRSKVA